MDKLIELSVLRDEIEKHMSFTLFYKCIRNGILPAHYFEKRAKGIALRRQYLNDVLVFLSNYKRGDADVKKGGSDD